MVQRQNNRQFDYQARDSLGRLVSGSMEADSPHTVEENLFHQGLYTIDVTARSQRIGWRDFHMWASRVSLRELAVMFRHFQIMLRAGIPLLECLSSWAVQTTNPRLRYTLQQVSNDVLEGQSLSESIARYPRVFPDLVSGLVEAGETTGELDQAMERLANYYDSDQQLRSKLISSLLYPAVVTGFAIVVVIVLVTSVLPTFEGMFIEMSVPLPLVTRILMGTASAIRLHWPTIGAVLAGVILVSIRLSRTRRVREWQDGVLFRLPVLGRFLHTVTIARLSSTLSALLGAGVPILRAMNLLQRTCGNVYVARELERVQARLEDGESLATALCSSRLFPVLLCQIVQSGDRSGDLKEPFAYAARHYERAVAELSARHTVLLEPLVVLVMGSLVGFILMAVLLPMVELSTTIPRM